MIKSVMPLSKILLCRGGQCIARRN